MTGELGKILLLRGAAGSGPAFALVFLAAIHIHQGHTVAPDAAGIQSMDAGDFDLAFQGCPVAKDDADVRIAAG